MQIYENNKNLIHTTFFLFTLILSLLFAGDYKTVDAKKIDKVETGTGLSSFTGNTTLSGAKGNREQSKPVQNTEKQASSIQHTEEGLVCDAECKKATLIGIGIREEIAVSLVENCKALADDPRKCIIAGASIVTSESSGGWNCRKNNKWNCFGIMQNNNYESYHDSTLHFAGKFQKWWRNAKSASFFYPSVGTYSPSRFCVSEHSSKSAIGCPNGQKNAQIVWDKLEKAF